MDRKCWNVKLTCAAGYRDQLTHHQSRGTGINFQYRYALIIEDVARDTNYASYVKSGSYIGQQSVEMFIYGPRFRAVRVPEHVTIETDTDLEDSVFPKVANRTSFVVIELQTINSILVAILVAQFLLRLHESQHLRKDVGVT
ncbi:uncharacterized protein LOC144474313 [Augochlora pura]